MIRWQCQKIDRTGKPCHNTYDQEDKPYFCPRCKNKKEWRKIEILEDPTEDDLKILTNPNLFEIILSEAEKKAVGEEEAKRSIALFCMGRLVANAAPTSFNAIPHEESGTGKDYLTRTITSLCVPVEKLAHRTRINQTTFTYWHDPKNDPDWTWDGVVLFLEDISDPILNCEVVKTFLSGGSKATITRNQEAIDIIIQGKPVCIFTTANSSPAGEQLRRIQFIPLDASPEQTRRIKEFQASRAKTGEPIEFDKKILSAIEKLRRVEAVIPFAEQISDCFPNELIVRTSQSRFFDLIRASAALHQYQRERDKYGRVIAIGQDYEIGRKVFLHNQSTSETLVPMSVHQKRITQTLKERSKLKYENEFEFMEVAEISGYIPMSKDGLYSNLEKLVVSRVLTVESGVILQSGKTGSRYRVNKNVRFDLPLFENLPIKSQNDQTEQTNQNSQNKQTKEEREDSTVHPVILARNSNKDSGDIPSDEIVMKELT